MTMASKGSVRRVCLAYSGGLDTSVILRWLIEQYDCEVVAYCADIGQEEELAGLPDKAKSTGAVDYILRDVREEFVREYVFPAIQGNAVYEGTYLLGTALARPLIAKSQVAVARETGCDALSHGATGKGNDQVRFELAYRALAPELKVVAPWREWDLRSRTDCMAYAEKFGIPVSATVTKPYSIDRNLLHNSFEGGILEDPWRAPEESMFITTTSPGRTPRPSSSSDSRRASPSRSTGRSCRRRPCWRVSTRSPGPTGWGGSTWSRTASSGSSPAASTRLRGARCCT
jgi:argininosuccinate synthase